MSNWLSWSWRPRGTTLAVGILAWITFLHVAGIYLFTRGFLLTRMALSDITSCSDGACTLPATHDRIVILIIDALRFDFVSPDPPHPVSPFHHHILTLPQELTRRDPTRSFIFNAYSDPPTTTMQRIKGITTGSLPTFIDMSANFGAVSIDEDSIINQLNRSGKRCAFMGDDTWMSVFPTLFSPNMTHPYDSFNVEDLHTVDEGVIRHVFPLLEDESHPWDCIVGHFLGVDHVGHRVGPDHPAMKEKLSQMDIVLRKVVEILEDDTLLVVLGDHGMDLKGDHGGDDIYETSSAMWFYSKGRPLRSGLDEKRIPPPLIPNTTYPDAPSAARWIQQIDIVPTISLLLGLPIPFNNLGTVIPELFDRYIYQNGKFLFALDEALKLNSRQVKRYLDAYHEGPSGHELDSVWGTLQASWMTTQMPGESGSLDTASRYFFTRFALDTCRSLWAQFNVVLMSVGLVVLAIGTFTAFIVYAKLGDVVDWEKWAGKRAGKIFRNLVAGVALSLALYVPLHRIEPGIGLLDMVLMFSSIASCVALILNTTFSINLTDLSYEIPVVLILHAISFFSNSFTFWEDRIVPFLLITSLAPSIRTGIISPDKRLGGRILVFSGLFAVCVRLMALSTVCREEQQPYCRVTFYASSSLPSPPLTVLALAFPISMLLPTVMRIILAMSGSDKNLVPSFLDYVVRPALLAANVCWFLEWLESSEIFVSEWDALLRPARTLIARATVGGLLVVASSLWWQNNASVEHILREVEVDDPSGDVKTRKVPFVLVNTNSYGAPYLLFWSIGLALVYLTMQLTGQVVLGLATLALLCYIEVCDSVRNVVELVKAFSSMSLSAALDIQEQKTTEKQKPFTFGQISTIALLALHTFFATGHQSTLSSLQWKVAFLLTPRLSYPSSPILVILNTFGPYLLFSLAVPFLAVWRLTPSSSPKSRSDVLGGSVRACLGVSLYLSGLLFTSAAGAAWLRRHLMVWKVFAPRYMFAALGLVVADVGAIIAVAIGVHRSLGQIAKLLQNSPYAYPAPAPAVPATTKSSQQALG